MRDLVCAEHGGAVHWYRNRGDAKAPRFTDSQTIANEGEDRPEDYLRVSAADLNGDGKMDLLVGANDGSRKPGMWVFYQE